MKGTLFTLKLMAFWLMFWSFGIALLVSPLHASSSRSSHEQLVLTPFEHGKVLAEFTFTREFPAQELQGSHFHSLPRSFGEVVQTYGVDELHLTFTQGRWKYHRWGYSPHSTASGVRLWAWLRGPENIDKRWKGLTHALAGLFCASLNFIDHTSSYEPRLTFPPEGTYAGNMSAQRLRYGTLPRESVCTENLTPWAKLLPCQTKSGLARLFNPYRLFDSSFHSIGVHFKPSCLDNDCTKRSFILEQSLVVVLDPVRLDSSKSWTLQSLFAAESNGFCPLSSASVQIKVPHRDPSASILPIKPDALVENVAYYSNMTGANDIGLKWIDSSLIQRESGFPMRLHRFQTGYGQERGGITANIYNHLNSSIQVNYLETIPWILRVYLHTMKIHSTSLVGNQQTSVELPTDRLLYQPAIDRVRPTLIELSLTLPPRSLTKISFKFDMAFLKYTEHPPDANRGFDIGSATLSVPSRGWRIVSETLLVSLPTPDFSMPYNVITFTCTVLALYFGSLFNTLTREYKPLQKDIKK